MKHLANLISLSRIILLFVLFFLLDHAMLFLILYLICGFSDVLDGFIARKTHTQSEFGAKLDSFADVLFFITITISVIYWMGNDIFGFLPWILFIFILRCINIAIAVHKYHSAALLHTWGNKLSGFLVFIAPLFLLYDKTFILYPVLIAAVLSAVEETFIHLTSSKLDLNRPSIFKR
ncbi:CDP-alcohol phosphatidyltransferase family protein [Clostridium aminobutyricum]|uniref:CDP-alcohol phosphatidyltransferase family protein n=1 Tax=Clostridium aminobutyricum TaxID=33953 RepID=UPI001FD68FF5|nr:CDP-alcohol phosphatidyltransferase family protein [Clostridium aminobutyricum]